MRPGADAERVRALADDLGRHASARVRVYERALDRDLADARAMLDRGMIDGARLLELFAEIESDVFRYPAIDPEAFRRRVHDFVSST